MVERSLLEVEGYVRDFAVDNPHVNVAMLRFSNVLGPDITTPLAKALELPVVPSVFGYDPRFQFVHETDVVRAILFVLEGKRAGHLQRGRRRAAPVERGRRDLRQAHLPAPAVRARACCRRRSPGSASTCRPSCSTCCATAAASTTAASSASGFDYRFTSAGTVADFVEALRIRTDGRQQRDRLPVRARRRAVLPPLPRRRQRR